MYTHILHMYMCVYIYIYIYIHMYTYIHLLSSLYVLGAPLYDMRARHELNTMSDYVGHLGEGVPLPQLRRE